MNRTNNQYQILSQLEGIDSHECRKSMLDFDSFVDRVQHKIFIQTFIVHCRNAKKSYMRKDDVSEKKSLIRALDIIDSEKISDEDLRAEELLDYITGTFLTSGKIANRLDELGVVVKW
ncbi:MAG: hypothetical protein EA390_11190 [Balneolaceae bacterium]|nr:MAG: hypothetical protein EA390_11190 [Balneolaceae bacterium]